MVPPAFITFEGLDGCGKSTQMERLGQTLRSQGRSVVVTREPGGTAWGERVREVVLRQAPPGLTPPAAEFELALMVASRAQSVREIIAPALQAGQWVLCDRFHDATEAYQGGGRGLDRSMIRSLHRQLCQDLQPTLTLWLDLPASESLARARRLASAGRFEQETQAFFGRVAAAYGEIAAREPDRVCRIPAGGSADEVTARIHDAVVQRLEARTA